MAINAYTGLMGSGKSYEVVSSIILPAVRLGRRVVTNIDGINPEAIYEYLEKKYSIDRNALGKIISVSNDDVCADNFFPTDDHSHDGKVVQGGDIVCIDEVWRFWGSAHKISPSTMNFFRMHRHFTSAENSLSCDVVLMVQDISSLNRNLRSVVEMTSRTVKLKTLGLHKAYRIELYEGHKLTNKTHIDTFNKKYDSEIFPLYKSYVSGSGKEATIDKRQNILRNPRIWVITLFALCFVVWGFYNLTSFFKSSDQNKQQSISVTQATPIPFSQLPSSMSWRVVGQVNFDGMGYVVIANPSGRLRLESPSIFSNTGKQLIGSIDGQSVTYWSGTISSSNPITPFSTAQK